MKLCFAIGFLVLIAAVILITRQKREGYSAYTVGSLDSLDSLGSYQQLAAPDMQVSSTQYADMVQGNNPQVAVQKQNMTINPLQRLEAVQGSQLLPRNAGSVTPYNIDVADKNSYLFMVQQPRVILKDPVRDYSLMTAIRGDIPIRYNNDVALIGRSQYGRDSWVGDGVYSDSGKALYNKYTGGEFLNAPYQVSNEETIMS